MIIHLVDVKGLASLDSIENSKGLIKNYIRKNRRALT